MNDITLSAVDGRTALGFLTALGVLRLLVEEVQDGQVSDARLAWDPMTGQAHLSVDANLNDVVNALTGVVQSIDGGARLPGGPAEFPGDAAPEDWPRGDPMRMPANEFSRQIARWRSRHGKDFIDRWVPAMVTDQVEDDKGCAYLTNLAAPSGQQKFSTMFDKPLQLVRDNPDLIREALMSWRRHDGVTGEYLDHRVIRSAADTTVGESTEAGVPGATWLALMALPWLPVTGVSGEAVTTGWQPRRRRRAVFVWPLWKDPLPSAAVRSLLSHPELAITEKEDRTLSIKLSKLSPLTVFAVYGAERQSIDGRNFAGVLSPVRIRT